jgi:hypothetical protein
MDYFDVGYSVDLSVNTSLPANIGNRLQGGNHLVLQHPPGRRVLLAAEWNVVGSR